MNLMQYIYDARAKPYEPGTHDCALFVAGWVEGIVGKDFTQGLRGQYSTVEQGFKKLRKMGHKDHIDLLYKSLKEREAVAFALQGDVVVCDTDDGQALGICTGENIVVLGQVGLVFLPLTNATRVFEVI